MKVSRIMWYVGTVCTTLAMLAASATAAAQERARTVYARSAAAAADSSRAERQRAANLKSFRGIAARLNTTPAALQNEFESARTANPKLSRGNFIAANVLADNLGPKHPDITVPAILCGLQNGRNMGQTLQSLGLTGAEAKQARRAVGRDTKEADKRVKDADKRARKAHDNK